MTARREPLERWRYPKDDILYGQVFPSGRPPFAPFPTVTNLLNTNLCPVAIYHDLLHGIEDALIVYPQKLRGELFHKFVAYLKLSLRNRDFELTGIDILTQQRRIQDLFFRFAQRSGFRLDEIGDIWRDYVEPWVRRKLEDGELERISPTDQFFFELSVGNYYVPFTLDSGIRNYPLRGRIDEIDLTRRRIIERTIRGSPSDTTPPLLKDYQVWLLWKILCSLRRDQLPSSWDNVHFQDFDLIVETPYADFNIPSENQDYVTDTHYAYAWINDISISESPEVFREVFENAVCSPENHHPKCRHPFINCFPRIYPYPRSRPGVRQTFQPWYRLLFWEQKWKGHLWQYQLLKLDKQELVKRGLILEARVVSSAGNQMELNIIGREASSLRGYDYCTIIPFGTLFCGLKLNARLSDIQETHFIIELKDSVGIFSQQQEALLLPPEITPPIMKEPPIFLDRRIQKDLFRLQYMGSERQDRAEQRSLIQLLEAIFGTRTLRR